MLWTRSDFLTVALSLTAFLAVNAATPAAQAGTLDGTIGQASGPRWAAAWLDLAQPRAFEREDILCFGISGARYVVVRLQVRGQADSSPKGLQPDIREVPSNGALRVELSSSYDEVVRISVHGGESAWHVQFPEDDGAPSLFAQPNGAPRLSHVKLLTGRSAC